MKRNKLIKCIFLLFGLFLVFICISMVNGMGEKDEPMKSKATNKKFSIIGKSLNKRKTRMSTTEQYITDINKLSYKSDDNGVFEGTYTLIHDTKEDERIVFYAILENSKTPLEFIVNNQKKAFHVVEMPKNGENKINFKFNNLPPGEHILYFFTEKYFDDYKTVESFEQLGFHNYISRYYFLIDVKSQHSEVLNEMSYKKTLIIDDIVEKGEKLSVFEDEELSEATGKIKNGFYYLLINNPYDFDIAGTLCVIADYEYKPIEDIVVTKNSKSTISIELDEEFIRKKESLRFLFLGTLQKSKIIKEDIPIRLMIPSQRFIVESYK